MVDRSTKSLLAVSLMVIGLFVFTNIVINAAPLAAWSWVVALGTLVGAAGIWISMWLEDRPAPLREPFVPPTAAPQLTEPEHPYALAPEVHTPTSAELRVVFDEAQAQADPSATMEFYSSPATDAQHDNARNG
ncbi:MAG: hypothetical protein H7Y11_00815 [Armatimonadetes bacterium]|nr:hypothetical protein [Anaerolineae bacterium]